MGNIMDNVIIRIFKEINDKHFLKFIKDYDYYNDKGMLNECRIRINNLLMGETECIRLSNFAEIKIIDAKKSVDRLYLIHIFHKYDTNSYIYSERINCFKDNSFELVYYRLVMLCLLYTVMLYHQYLIGSCSAVDIFEKAVKIIDNTKLNNSK